MKTEYLEYLGVIAFVVATYVIVQATPEDIYGMLQLVGGMILISISSPCIGFVLRNTLIGEKIEESMRMYILLVALNLIISAVSLGLVVIAEIPSWNLLSPIGTAVIGIIPFLAKVIEVE